MTTVIAMTAFDRVWASNYHAVQIISGLDSYHTNIESATKDSQGFVWFIAGSLLYRYDGITVKPFGELYNGPLHFTEVNKLMADGEGRLWFETRNGLVIFDTQKWKFIKDTELAKDLWGEEIIAMSARQDQQYIATKSGRLWQINGNNKRKLLQFNPTFNELRRPLGNRLIADHEKLWFAYNEQLFFVDLKSGSAQKFKMPKNIYKQLDDLFLLQNGLLLRNYGLGYFTFDGNSYKKINPKGLSQGDMRDWAHWSFTEKNNIVFLFEDGRYFEFKDDLKLTPLLVNHHTIQKDLLKSKLNQLNFNIDEGLCSTEKGLYSISKTSFDIQYWNTGTARGILQQQDHYYIGGYAPLKSFQLHNTAIDGAGPLNNYYAFLPVNRDSALVGLEGDFLGFLIKGQFKKAPYHKQVGTQEDLSSMVFSLAHYQKNQYLVGTYSGIWIYDMQTKDVFPLRDRKGLVVGIGQRINSLRHNNQIISFTSENGYFEFKAGTLHKVYPQNGEKLHVFTHAFKKNKVFLATKGKGLVEIDTENNRIKTYSNADGLASNVIFSMLWVNDLLFLGTFRGLSVWDGENFYSAFSMHGLPFEEFNQPSMYFDQRQDRLLIGGVLGCIAINPQNFLTSIKRQKVPWPVLASVRVGNSSNDIIRSYTPAATQDTILMNEQAVFVNLQLAKIDSYKNNYKTYFRLRPLIKTFQELTASGQINLSDLKTGEYEIEVRTVSDNGLSMETRKWLLYKKPRFYETQIFYVLLTLTTGGAIYILTIVRSSQIKRDKKLRLELSRDLHDEVGGLLTGIAMQTDLLALEKEETMPNNSLEKISGYSREAVQTMDDIIWSIDSRNNNQGSLEDRMKFLMGQLLTAQDIHVTFETEIHTRSQLPQYVRQNVYLIFKEALHNICKHSPSAVVKICLKIDYNKLELEISNTLVGSHVELINKKNFRKGQGLNNMERRAEAIDGKIIIEKSATDYTLMLTANLKLRKLLSQLF